MLAVRNNKTARVQSPNPGSESDMPVLVTKFSIPYATQENRSTINAMTHMANKKQRAGILGKIQQEEKMKNPTGMDLRIRSSTRDMGRVPRNNQNLNCLHRADFLIIKSQSCDSIGGFRYGSQIICQVRIS